MEISPKELVELLIAHRAGAPVTSVVNATRDDLTETEIELLRKENTRIRKENRGLRGRKVDPDPIDEVIIRQLVGERDDLTRSLDHASESVTQLAEDKRALSAALETTRDEREKNNAAWNDTCQVKDKAIDRAEQAQAVAEKLVESLRQENERLQADLDPLDKRDEHAEMMVKGLTKHRDELIVEKEQLSSLLDKAVSLVEKAQEDIGMVDEPAGVTDAWKSQADDVRTLYGELTT